MLLLGALIAVAFAALGRWIQLHPERIVPKGQFVGPDSTGARTSWVQAAVLGTFIVFAGTAGAVSESLSILTSNSVLLGWIVRVVGIVVGIVAAVYVRQEVKREPPYVTNTPHSWWP